MKRRKEIVQSQGFDPMTYGLPLYHCSTAAYTFMHYFKKEHHTITKRNKHGIFCGKIFSVLVLVATVQRV
jgi:hypothetical protein